MRAPLPIPNDGLSVATDYSRWRLQDRTDDGGRHIWDYVDEKTAKREPQSLASKYWLGMDLGLPPLPKAKTPIDAARNGYTFYKKIQMADGHWAGEYGGPMFLLPGFVIGGYVTGIQFKEEQGLEIIRYLFNRAHPDDGGWGIHIEGHSTVFGTALNYCVLRILGVPADHPVMTKARGTLHKLGGATGIPAWGKFWLSVLNVYDWSGNNPVPAELWLLPEWLPVYPAKWWIHTRNVYIPMSYISGTRFKAELTPFIESLRQELYVQPYASIDWPAQRNNVASVDIYSPHTFALDSLMFVLGVYNDCAIPPIRRAGLNRAYELVVREDENTSYQTIGPVSKMMNMIVRYIVDGEESEAFKMHAVKMRDFLWMGKEGMMACGTNGSQLWDIAFITQALVETGLGDDPDNHESMTKALDWLNKCQIRDNPKHYESAYRHRTKGAWPFSTKEQGYTVSDCTAEGLKSVLYLQEHMKLSKKPVSEARLRDAVDTLLSLQNPSGGFASYELIRGPHLLELINPAEVFGNIMTEYDYPECTTSVITALSIFKRYYPHYRAKDIETATRRAIGYLHGAQRPSGGWFGSWGICYTYATMFALESLSLVGESYKTSERVRRACTFLISKQRSDGGWGESYKTCETAEYTEHAQTQVVQTAWAGMALMYAGYPYRKPLEKAVGLIMNRQLPDGSWAQEAVEGVFNKNCVISYPNFKFSFTIWMLGKAHSYLERLDELDD